MEKKEKFVITFKRQKEWLAGEAWAFFLGGIGAGAFLLSAFVGYTAGLIAGLILVAVGKSAAHALTLSRRERGWRAFAKPSTSWISRGLIFTLLFVVVGILYTLGSFEALKGLLWAGDGAWRYTAQVIVALLALLVMTYPGFVMSMPSIPFWNTSLLPVVFAISSLLGGLGLVMLMQVFSAQFPIGGQALGELALILVLASMLVVASHMVTAKRSTLAARESASLLTKGVHSIPFVGGVVIAGLIIPLIVATLAYFGGTGSPGVLALAGILQMAGVYLLIHSFLKAGIYSPILE